MKANVLWWSGRGIPGEILQWNLEIMPKRFVSIFQQIDQAFSAIKAGLRGGSNGEHSLGNAR